MQNSQSGSALAISLVILTAITLISITSLQRSGLQTKIVSNIQHREHRFNGGDSEQQYWFRELQKSISGDNLLAEPLRKFTINALGEKTYSPVDLDMSIVRKHVTVDSKILFIPPVAGRISLATGEEAGQRINYRFNLDSESSIPSIDKSNKQQTGINFPALNSSQHSKI